MKTEEEIKDKLMYLTTEMHKSAEFHCYDLAFVYYNKVKILEWILEGCSNEN